MMATKLQKIDAFIILCLQLQEQLAERDGKITLLEDEVRNTISILFVLLLPLSSLLLDELYSSLVS